MLCQKYIYFSFCGDWMNKFFVVQNIFIGVAIETVMNILKPIRREHNYFYFSFKDISRIYQILIKNGLEDGYISDITLAFQKEYMFYNFFDICIEFNYLFFYKVLSAKKVLFILKKSFIS